MSPVRRVRSASVERRFSRRFFSRITCWDFCGFDQRLGSAACLSISANCGRSLPASKILLKFLDFFLQSGVFLLEFSIDAHASTFFLLLSWEAGASRDRL